MSGGRAACENAGGRAACENSGGRAACENSGGRAACENLHAARHPYFFQERQAVQHAKQTQKRQSPAGRAACKADVQKRQSPAGRAAC